MRHGAGGVSLIRIVLLLVALALLVLVLAQLFLPGIAANRIRSRIGRYGTVQSVHVSAWPAVKLLWGSADSVRVSASRLALTPEQTADLLAEARHTGRVDATVAEVREGPLRLAPARLRKRGSQLSGEGVATAADVRAALPPGVRVTLLGSEGGRVRVRVSGGLFGLGAALVAVAGPDGGALVARPLSPLLAALHLTLFSDRRIEVQGVSAAAQPPGATPAAYRLTMTARMP
jgi:hypothetical protein